MYFMESEDNLTIEEIEELIYYNLSYDVPVKQTLIDINRLDLLTYFLEN